MQTDFLKRPQADFLMSVISDIPGKDLLTGHVSSRALGVGLALVSAAYGGLHVSAWNSYFPTWEERIVWRISAIAVVVGGMAASFVIVSDLIDFSLGSCLIMIPHKALGLEVITAGAFLIYVIYCCCRIFLVVEAFVSIRKLPIDAYKTPAWTQLLPHF